MKQIPLHKLDTELRQPKFEVALWKKAVSRYDVSLPHRHNYYEVLVFLKGGGSHEIDFTAYPIKSNSLHFVSANQVHVVKRLPKSEGFSLLFAEEFLGANFQLRDLEFYKPGTERALNISSSEFKLFKNLLDEIHKEYFSENNRKREVLQSLMQVLLIRAQRYYEQLNSTALPAAQNRSQFSAKLEQLIEKNYHLHWRAGDYARALNVSLIHLNNLCKQHFSKSTEALLQERLMLEIKRALVYSNKAVKEICFELNFEDPAYFVRFFKKHAGVTPLEYRKSVQH
ncbi:MAG: helix-turn-helix domain-containing protein [Chitinophagales bacterium]